MLASTGLHLLEIVGNATNGTKNATEEWEIFVYAGTGAFALGTLILTVFLVVGHLRYWDTPEHQTYIVRLLIMAPVYGVDSFFSIYWRNLALYFNLARDCYEAYALYIFFVLLVKYVESEDEGTDDGYARPIEDIIQYDPPQKHMVPLCCLKPIQPGALYMIWIKRLILQYTIVKPLCSLIACILNPFDMYGEGDFSPKTFYLYSVVIVNISVSISLYCLVLFYHTTIKYIKPYRPLLKFLTIKAVVFFSFWQTVVIGILGWKDVIPPIGNWTADEVATGINNLLICVEMFLISIANFYVFHYRGYKPAQKNGPRAAGKVFKDVFKNFAKDVLNHNDVVSDVKTAFGKKGISQAREKHHLYKETSALLREDEALVDLDRSETDK